MRLDTRLGVLAVISAVHLACGGEGPTGPTPTAATRPIADMGAADSDVSALQNQNARPTLVLKTTPVAEPGDPYPVIRAFTNSAVKFNLCNSSDSDAGDSINWQFHFGDDGSPPFNSDGTFNANFGQFCRTEHSYERVGTYTATLSVTDKHLDDQSNVGALARSTTQVTVDVRDGCGDISFNGSPVDLSVGQTDSHLRASSRDCTVAAVSVSLHITTTFTNEHEVVLIGPNGGSSQLFNHRGGSGTNIGASCGDRAVFTDGAANPIGSGAAPFNGAFRPETPLSVFNGRKVDGQWILRVTDTFGSADSLNCWSLFISGR